MKTALTIAGSDSSGGAGIQADIKTMTVNGVYAMSAITALTAQNTLGVTDIMKVTPEFLEAQLKAVFTDIPPDAVKTGMTASGELVEVIARALKKYGAKNIVVDPVMVATSGCMLTDDAAISALEAMLLPLADIITPNIPEAQVLADMEIKSDADMCAAAEKIGSMYKCAVLLKGGHSTRNANDVLYMQGRCEWFYGRRIENTNTHGTGCTLSSAIAASLARGLSVYESVSAAKKYISGALSYGLNLGKGAGPLNHAFGIKNGE